MRPVLFLLPLLLAACADYSANVPSLKPYKMDIQQGNVVTPKMMMQLRPGMTKAQVRFVMGTPLIADSFHAQRWDYFYQMRRAGKIIEQRRVILEFEDDKLQRVRGDVVPASGGDTASEARAATRAPVTLKSATDTPKQQDKGLLDRLKFWKDDKDNKDNKDDKDKETQPVAPASQPPLPRAAEPEKPVLPPKAAEPPPPAPVAKPVPAEVSRPAPQPARVEPQSPPAAPPPPKAEGKGWLNRLKFWKVDDSTDAAKPAEAVKAEPVKPVPKPVEVTPQKMPEPATKPVPKPADNLPAEDDPGYFERMLEKIGF